MQPSDFVFEKTGVSPTIMKSQMTNNAQIQSRNATAQIVEIGINTNMECDFSNATSANMFDILVCILKRLQSIEPSYSNGIKVWSQLRSRYYIIYKPHKTLSRKATVEGLMLKKYCIISNLFT